MSLAIRGQNTYLLILTCIRIKGEVAIVLKSPVFVSTDRSKVDLLLLKFFYVHRLL